MFRRRLAPVLAATLALVPALAACNPDKQAAAVTSDGMIANLTGGSFTDNANPQQIFNPYLPGRLNSTYIYEPLYIINGYNCEPTPWLATSYSWTDPQHLTITTRQGVKWSDGQPFTAKDVAYTFNLFHKVPAFDGYGVWNTLSSVEAQGDDKVLFTFASPSVETFTQIAMVQIVPEHVWSKEADLLKFTDPNPVGTGPFLYDKFNTQQLIFKRNPDYWQADKIKVQQLTFTNNGGGGDADKLRLAQGAYDWNSMFVADIDKTYVSKDPQHNKYWFPPGSDISLYMPLTQAPFNDVKFRQALVYAIDRDEIAKKAQYGYVKTASQTGLVLPGQKGWLSPKYANLGVYPFDPAKTKQMLQAAGYQYSGNKLLGKDGKPMHFTFDVEAGWLDWIQAANIIKGDLAQVGIDIDVRTGDPDKVMNDRALGNYQMQFGVHGGGCNMFTAFDDPLGTDRTAAIGKTATANFVRYSDPNTDKLLSDLRSTTDVAKQKDIVAQLQDVMVEQVPMIPLWYGAQWFEYRTANAEGWPSAENPYASPGDVLIIMTKLTPPAKN